MTDDPKQALDELTADSQQLGLGYHSSPSLVDIADSRLRDAATAALRELTWNRRPDSYECAHTAEAVNSFWRVVRHQVRPFVEEHAKQQHDVDLCEVFDALMRKLEERAELLASRQSIAWCDADIALCIDCIEHAAYGDRKLLPQYSDIFVSYGCKALLTIYHPTWLWQPLLGDPDRAFILCDMLTTSIYAIIQHLHGRRPHQAAPCRLA